jgi:hypothetical protein
MTHLKELGILGLATALALGVGVSGASAKTIGGMGGKPSSNADASCANYAYGSLTNSCSTTKSFVTPLPISTGGTKTFSYRGYGAASTNNVGCKVVSMASISGYWATPTVYLSQFGSVQDVSLGSLYVDGNYPVYMNCSIDNGGQLVVAGWDE